MGERHEATFTKRATRGDNLPGEAAALAWLAEAEKDGGIRVVCMLRASATELVEERVRTGVPTAAAARRIGAALARTHAAGAPWYGCAPAGWTGAPWHPLGRTPYVAASVAPTTLGSFYAEYRIRHHVRTLVGNGTFDRDAPTGGVLVDPMACGGHAETDLAMLALFGCPYLDEIVAGYDEASPLAGGWRERVGLHQLAPLLHCVLFGGAYVPQTLAVARRYA
ncbi:MAG: fructosamine kinase family protein [Atopobiaceae bacterium]|nr:fructosamine kinase family protein [Atopobiaceae bacterium]